MPLALVLLTAFPQVLSAQESGSAEKQATGTPKAKTEQAERIQVTGSRIKRSDAESSSPVSVISRKDIERSGAATLGEILRTEATSTEGNFAGSSTFVRAGSQTASLYGLGAGRTLVLLDGERLPKDASLSGTNLNLIPASMIDRIETLSGGRSAVYGSDAVAGVINIITRKNLVGNEVETFVRAPQGEGGNKLGLTASSGFMVGSTTNVIIGGGYEKSQRIYRKNRDYAFGEGKFINSQYAKPVGTFDYRILPPGNATPQLWEPSPNCPAGNVSDLRGPDQPNRGNFCVGDARANASDEILPGTEGGFFSTRLSSEIGSSSLNAFASYTQTTGRTNSGNYFSSINYLNQRRQILNAETANALNLGFTVPDGSSVEIYKVDELAPDRIAYNKDQAYGGFLSLDTPIGQNWDSKITLTHYTSESHRDVDNIIDKIPYTAALHSPNPTYIVADPNRDPSILKSLVNRMSSSERNGMTAAGVNFSSEVAELPAGALAVNVGVDNRIETYQQIPDGLDTEFYQNQPRFTGTESVSGRGDRNVASLYAEAIVPVVAGLEVDTAVRYDNYSDFGDTTNYNYGVKYQPVDGLTLRHSGGTAFHAPELNYVHQNGGGGYVSIRDEGYCRYRASINNPCIGQGSNSIFVDRPGNKDLQPETSRSYSIGFLIEPSDNVFLSADYLAFSLKNEFTLKPTQDIVDDFYAGKSTGRSTVSQTGEGELAYITSVARPWENISDSNLQLVQYEASAATKPSSVKYRYGTKGTRLISKRDRQSDGTLRQSAGYEGTPKWRWSNVVSAAFSDYEVALSADTTARQAPDPENHENYLPTYFNDQVDEFTQYNAALSWDFTNTGHVTLGVNNLANKFGGTYRTGNFSGAETQNSYLYSQSYVGRSYFATLNQKF